MAEKKRNPVKAPIFKQTPKINYNVDIKTEHIFSKIIPRQLKFYESTPNVNRRLLNVNLARSERKLNPSRMLIYEDSSEEDEDEEFRSTPPNIQERNKPGTPGAPIKSRKEFEKKVLRPKKLVYNDKENENNQFYYNTPKKSLEKNVEKDDDNFFYEKFLNTTSTIAKKIIIPVIEDDSNNCSVYHNNRQIISAGTSGRSTSQQDRRNNSRGQAGRKKNLNNESRRATSKSTGSKINDLNCNKENNAVQLAIEKDLESGELNAELLSKNRAVKNDKNRDDFDDRSSKMGELTHFRI